MRYPITSVPITGEALYQNLKIVYWVWYKRQREKREKEEKIEWKHIHKKFNSQRNTQYIKSLPEYGDSESAEAM